MGVNRTGKAKEIPSKFIITVLLKGNFLVTAWITI